jgi:glycosyltransferase involved in cell wall biosynthesis
LCDTIFREAEKSLHKKDIQFLGPVSNETLVYLYNFASCFLYPSFFEGFGIPPLEAQACGTPVIVSNRSSFPESIGSTGLMADPWRTEEIAYALESILLNDTFADELRKRGRENIKRFSWEKSVEKIFSTLVTLHGKSEISNKKY